MRRKTKQEIESFAENMACLIIEDISANQLLDVCALITKKVVHQNTKTKVNQELADMNKYLSKRFGIKLDL